MIYVISMEFLSLIRRRSSSRNVPSGEEQGEMDVFAGYDIICIYVLLHNFTRFLRKKGE